MILDCVPFFAEHDIWCLRYETLRDVVDGVVVVEARHTHSGAAKAAVFEGWNPVLCYNLVDLPDPGLPGIPATRRREMFQRNAIVETAGQWGALPDDTILLISDCDEIPHPEAVRGLRRRGLADGEVAVFLQRLHYYNLNTTSPQPWFGTRAARWADVRALSPHVIRNGLGQPDAYYPRFLHWGPEGWFPADQDGPRLWAGWHLSYFGTPEQVQAKMQSFLHQELVTAENTDPEAIAARIAAGADVWGRDGNGHGFTVGDAVDVPPPVAADPQRWRHLYHPAMAPTEAG
jgi:beta-1,4-mannosyl-glycoprotein beta-1,4-N-acetylglucosaminyltransferase